MTNLTGDYGGLPDSADGVVRQRQRLQDAPDLKS